MEYVVERAKVDLAFLAHAGASLFDDSAEQLRYYCNDSNAGLVATLRPDKNAEALNELALADWRQGRMSCPTPLREVDASQARCFFATYIVA